MHVKGTESPGLPLKRGQCKTIYFFEATQDNLVEVCSRRDKELVNRTRKDLREGE